MIRRRIFGTMKVPLYLDKPEPGGKFVLDAQGLPMQNGTAEFEFLGTVLHDVLTEASRRARG